MPLVIYTNYCCHVTILIFQEMHKVIKCVSFLELEWNVQKQFHINYMYRFSFNYSLNFFCNIEIDCILKFKCASYLFIIIIFMVLIDLVH